MFISVIAAYVIATAFAFCGVVMTVGFIMESQQGMGAVLFIEGLAVAMWPLAVATSLVMLVQLACKVERWMYLWTIAQSADAHAPKPRPTASAPASPQRPAGPPPAVPSAFASHLAAVTPPVMPEAPTAERITPPAMPAPAPPAAPTLSEGANESSPPAGTIPLPPKPEPRPDSQPAPRQEALNFFKLD